MIGGLIGPIANLAGTFLQGRLEKAKANTEVKVATAKAKAKIDYSGFVVDNLIEARTI